ncbi:cysteine desulfurase family protein [Alphaproteobacteria bacterium]|nr:cysteine desulfurase family protein [Alphaproteobacteria bacterium]
MRKLEQSTYLDYNATVPILADVKDAVIECMNLGPLNASSIHSFGRKGKNIIETSRENISDLINVKVEDIIFTSSATEATNLLFNNFETIIVSAIEHLAVLSSSKSNLVVKVNKNGIIDLNSLEDLLKTQTSHKQNVLVSIMWVNNETGVIQPIDDVICLARKYGCLIHCDAAQALGKVKIDLKKNDLDFLTLSGHKIGAPSGIGALVVNNNFHLSAQIFGGGQEKGMRAGTENILGICGFGIAANILSKVTDESFNEITTLRDYLIKKIKLLRPETVLFGEHSSRVNNTILIALPNIPGDLSLMKLDLDGFAVSSGSACSSGKISESHVINAMNFKNLASNSIRISLPPNTKMLKRENLITTNELDRLAQCWSNL